MRLSVPGRHNVLNALAAVAMCQELGVAWTDTVRALNGFRGAERRFERRGEVNGITVIEDYGHHPTEIAAALAAARHIAGSGRVIVAFQPHRFTRTQMLLKEFGPAFVDADVVVLTDIYAAGEDQMAGVTVDLLAKAIQQSYKGELQLVRSLADVPQQLKSVAKPDDLIILLGAGSIGSIAGSVLDALEGNA
jgi:UDP-N-acetylmuramate--alanine ligase